MQNKSKVISEQCNDIEQSSSQLPNTPQITLLDDDEEENDDVPLAKLSRISKRQEVKGKKIQLEKTAAPNQKRVGTSGNQSKTKSARRLGKPIKQE